MPTYAGNIYTDIPKYRLADTQIYIYIQTYNIQTYSQTHKLLIQLKHTDIRTSNVQTYRLTDIQKRQHSAIQTYRHTDLPTYRHIDIQTYRYADIQHTES